MTRFIRIGAVLCLSLVLFSACFQIRDVAPPGTSSSGWISPTSYDILLDNLSRAITQKNTQNYLRCFNRDQLDYTPAATLLNDRESIWQNWSIDEEQTYFNNLLANVPGNSGGILNLERLEQRDVNADSLIYIGNYVLQVSHNVADVPKVFQGQVQWEMKLNEFNEWEIQKWVDLETVADSSWSLLKLTFSQ